MVVESLQALCTVALRIYYTTPSTALTVVASAGSSVTRRTATPRTTTIPMIDRRAIKVFFESLDVEDNPTLQVESVRALTAMVDRLTEDEQDNVKEEAILVLINLLDNKNDEATRDMAATVVRDLVTGDCDVRRDLVLRQLVEGLRGDDPEEQDIYSYWLALILNMNDPSPDIVQRVVVDTGTLPRFAQLFRSRRDDAYFQREAVCALSAVMALGDPDAITAIVVDEGVIPALVRVLRNPHGGDDDEIIQFYSASAIESMAQRLPLCRDLIVQSGAVEALLDLILQSPGPDLIEDGASALEEIFSSLPSPDFSSLRPLVPNLVRLLSRPEECVVAVICQALLCLTDEDDTEENVVVQAVVEAGAGRQLVELLRHPSPEVHTPALFAVGNIVLGTDQQLQAIMEHQPLESLAAMLSSPEGLIRGKCCWVIGNLAEESQERIEQLIEHGIFPLLVRCLADPDVIQRELAARAVGEAIAPSGTPRQVHALVEAGCLSPLCDLLASNPDLDNDRVPFYALEGIENALAAGENFRDDDDSNYNDDSQSGAPTNPVAARIAMDRGGDGLDKIRGLLRHPNDDLHARAARVLTTYFGSDPNDARAGNKRRRRRSD